MSNNLVIVESPAKAKTIQKFIGKDFDVISSKGHVRDLPEKNIGVDIKNQFCPKYEILTDKKALIADIKRKAKEAHAVWLATDDDREGEAISWHLMEVADIAPEKVKRIVFHEITKSAIDNALKNPRNIDIDLVNAQQARRVLDRIVGFELSPVLWVKVKPHLSAGRVQSVAVKLIVEREHEIQRFNLSTFFKITGDFKTNNKEILETSIEKKFNDYNEAINLLKDCKSAVFTVDAVETNPGKKTPAAPFTTSTLQQEASKKMGFSVSKTMMVAQQLYEAGCITYMRTDSVNIAETALVDIENQIVELYGKEYHKKRRYAVKSKNAQEAHEAIRPTSMAIHSAGVDNSEKKLYELIWKRTIASQMSDAKTEKTTIFINVSNRSEKFISVGEVLLFQGFLKVYMESKDEEDEIVKGLLPTVNVGENLDAVFIKATQKYAQPPARYTEASLVKKLEELGIGRPSTYAPTISTIQKRKYAVKETREGNVRNIQEMTLQKNNIVEKVKTEKFGVEKDKLFPTDIGVVVNDFLLNNFEKIMDYSFTADVEKEFDNISEGKMDWKKMLENFYGNFHDSVTKTMTLSTKANGERVVGTDPVSGKKVLAKLGKYGPMVQIGETTDEEKPKFARLKTSQSLETVTLEEAMELFKLPKTLGEYKGNSVIVGVGRFGPYIKVDNKFISIPKGKEPADMTIDMALELIEQKEKNDMESAPRLIGKYEEKDLYIAKGRYGPYLKYDNKNYNIDKNIDISSLTLEKAIELFTKKDEKIISSFKENENIKVLKGRYGPYISDGKNNYKIPKNAAAENLTFKDVSDIITNSLPATKKRIIRKQK